jgi:hypothetical protein
MVCQMDRLPAAIIPQVITPPAIIPPTIAAAPAPQFMPQQLPLQAVNIQAPPCLPQVVTLPPIYVSSMQELQNITSMQNFYGSSPIQYSIVDGTNMLPMPQAQFNTAQTAQTPVNLLSTLLGLGMSAFGNMNQQPAFQPNYNFNTGLIPQASQYNYMQPAQTSPFGVLGMNTLGMNTYGQQDLFSALFGNQNQQSMINQFSSPMAQFNYMQSSMGNNNPYSFGGSGRRSRHSMCGCGQNASAQWSIPQPTPYNFMPQTPQFNYQMPTNNYNTYSSVLGNTNLQSPFSLPANNYNPYNFGSSMFGNNAYTSLLQPQPTQPSPYSFGSTLGGMNLQSLFTQFNFNYNYNSPFGTTTPAITPTTTTSTTPSLTNAIACGIYHIPNGKPITGSGTSYRV